MLGEYRFLKHLDLLHTACMLSSLALVHRMVSIFGVDFSVASLIFPITFVITNIIARVYGVDKANQVMWRGIAAQVPFTLLSLGAQQFPYPNEWHAYPAYHYVFSDLLRITIASVIGAAAGYRINIWVLSNITTFCKKRLFILSNFSACSVGEICFTLIALPIMFLHSVTLSTLCSMIFVSICIKLLYSASFCLPSGLVARLLETHEPQSIYHSQTLKIIT